MLYLIPTSVDDPFASRVGGGPASLPSLFGIAINLILGIGWGFAFLYLALGFIKFVLSHGDVKEVQKARLQITYAIVGVFILFVVTAYKMVIAKGITGNTFEIGNVTNFVETP